MAWWYLSFVEIERLTGEQWLRGAFVEADNFEAALSQSAGLGINPGVSVKGAEFLPHRSPPAAFCGRLRTRDDLIDADKVRGGSGELKAF